MLLCDFYIFVISIISLIFIWSNYLSLLENKKFIRKLKKINFPILIKRPVSPNKARREQIPNRSLRARLLSRLDCAFAFPRLWNAPGVRPSHRLCRSLQRASSRASTGVEPMAVTDPRARKADTLPTALTAPQSLFTPVRLRYAYRFHWLICLSSPLQFPTAPRLLI